MILDNFPRTRVLWQQSDRSISFENIFVRNIFSTEGWVVASYTWISYLSVSLCRAVSRYDGGESSRRSWPAGRRWRWRCPWRRGSWLICCLILVWLTHPQYHKRHQPPAPLHLTPRLISYPAQDWPESEGILFTYSLDWTPCAQARLPGLRSLPSCFQLESFILRRTAQLQYTQSS